MCQQREAPEPLKLGGRLLGGSGACQCAGAVLKARSFRRRPKAARPGLSRHRQSLKTTHASVGFMDEKPWA